MVCFLRFGIPVVVGVAGTDSDVDCSNGFLYVCITVGVVDCFASAGICCSDIADADVGIVGFGGLKPALTVNHVSPDSPSSVLLARGSCSCSSKSSVSPSVCCAHVGL